MVSHPSRKNKDAARVGHPGFVGHPGSSVTPGFLARFKKADLAVGQIF